MRVMLMLVLGLALAGCSTTYVSGCTGAGTEQKCVTASSTNFINDRSLVLTRNGEDFSAEYTNNPNAAGQAAAFAAVGKALDLAKAAVAPSTPRAPRGTPANPAPATPKVEPAPAPSTELPDLEPLVAPSRAAEPERPVLIMLRARDFDEPAGAV